MSHNRVEIYAGIVGLAKQGTININTFGHQMAEWRFRRAAERFARAHDKLTAYSITDGFGVGIMGSARIPAGTAEYEFGEQLGRALSRIGKGESLHKGKQKESHMHLVVGGGPGFMEAPVKAAYEQRKQDGNGRRGKRAQSLHGIRIKLPFEEDPNPYLDSLVSHELFGTRLPHFDAKIQAVIILPGGIGSDLELDYFTQLYQVKHLEPNFLMIVHPSYKGALEERYAEKYTRRIAQGLTPLVSKDDFDQIVYSDSVHEITGLVAQRYHNWEGTIGKQVRRTRLLPSSFSRIGKTFRGKRA